jgi:hypothetical protein
MYEAIVTLVHLESDGGYTYPVAEVYRLEFDTIQAMELWRDSWNYLQAAGGLVNVEQLKA